MIPYIPLLKPHLGSQIVKGHSSGPAGGLVGCWLMNENGKVLSTILDSSGNENTGSLIADTHFVPGKFGSALDFDGTGDYVELVGTADFTQDFTQFSVVTLIKNDNIELPINHEYVNKASSTTAWRLYKGINESWNFHMYVSVAVFTQITSAANIDEDLLWHCLVGTWDGSDLRLYVDNKLVAGPTAFAGPIRNIADTVKFGVNVDGQQSHVMIYNRALGSSEIALLVQEPFVMFKDPNEVALLGGFVAAAGTILPQITSAYMRI